MQLQPVQDTRVVRHCIATWPIIYYYNVTTEALPESKITAASTSETAVEATADPQS